MDTRTKIIEARQAQELARSPGTRWITGHFDPLLVEHVRLLKEEAAGRDLLIVEVTNPERPLLAQRARAELVAALEMVDYVVMSDRETAPDAELTRRFVEHVRRRTNGAHA